MEDEKMTDVVDETLWRVTLDLREGPNGTVAVYPREGDDPKADLLYKSIAQNAGEKMSQFSVSDDAALENLLTHTIQGVDVYHLYRGGRFDHYSSAADLLAALNTPRTPETPAVGSPVQDMVNSPSHYAPNGVDSFMHMKDQMGTDAFRGFLQGNALKYVQRHAFKGKPVEDLEKAAFYLFHLAFDVASDDMERRKLRRRISKTLGHASAHYKVTDEDEDER